MSTTSILHPDITAHSAEKEVVLEFVSQPVTPVITPDHKTLHGVESFPVTNEGEKRESVRAALEEESV